MHEFWGKTPSNIGGKKKFWMRWFFMGFESFAKLKWKHFFRI